MSRKTINERIDYFYDKLEDIIDDPVNRLDSRITALKIYAQLFPTIQNVDITNKTTYDVTDISQLTLEDKTKLDSLLKKLTK